MCGICGYIGSGNGVKEVVGGLKILEYRGYDSCGLAFIENEKINIVKTVGEVDNLKKLTKNMSANVVIGHTRWATHGGVNERNAHPHISTSGKLAMVHNGIIENYKELKEEFNLNSLSNTDSEVFLNLIDCEKGTLINKVINASKKVQGTFAVLVLGSDGELVLGKCESPLYLSKVENEVYIASDVLALKGENYFALNDHEFASVKNRKIIFYNKNGEKITKKSEKIEKIVIFLKFFIKHTWKAKFSKRKMCLIKH